MAAITFDTLKFANRLKSAGVPDKHAEAEAEALSEVLEINAREFVSHQDIAMLSKDIQHLEERFDARLHQMEKQLDSRLIQLEQRMTIKLGGLMVVAVGMVAALVKIL